MSIFDGISKAVFSTVEEIMGDAAIWTPSDGSGQKTVKVLFNNPEKLTQLGDSDKIDYYSYKYWFEYYIDQLTGLKQAVDSGIYERVSVNGFDLAVKEVRASLDGRNYIAYCVLYE